MKKGIYLEPENMTRPQIIASGKFYQRTGEQRRGQVLLRLATYHEEQGLPELMTFKEWHNQGCPKLKP